MNSMVNVLGKWVAPCGLVLAFLAPVGGAQAGRYQILHTFSGQPDGDDPWSALIEDGAGNLYGTTLAGVQTTGAPFSRSLRTAPRPCFTVSALIAETANSPMPA